MLMIFFVDVDIFGSQIRGLRFCPISSSRGEVAVMGKRPQKTLGLERAAEHSGMIWRDLIWKKAVWPWEGLRWL